MPEAIGLWPNVEAQWQLMASAASSRRLNDCCNGAGGQALFYKI